MMLSLQLQIFLKCSYSMLLSNIIINFQTKCKIDFTFAAVPEMDTYCAVDAKATANTNAMRVTDPDTPAEA